MRYIEGHARDQMLLLPASVDDYVAADNPARLIAAFVDELDLGELGFDRARPKVGVGYNAQVAVDARHKLIVEQHVTNAGSDLELLAQTAGAAREQLGIKRIAGLPTRATTRAKISPLRECGRDPLCSPSRARPRH